VPVVEVCKFVVVTVVLPICPHPAAFQVDSSLQCAELEPQNPHFDRHKVTSLHGSPLQVPSWILIELVVVVEDDPINEAVVVALVDVLVSVTRATVVVDMLGSEAKHWLTILNASVRSFGLPKMHSV
jgi:hypothetical protein